MNISTCNSFLSDKIRILSFISIILVLYIHSDFHEYPHEIQGMKFNIYLQEFVSGKIGRLAVPLFFAISGFLFFVNTNMGFNVVWIKMRKRVRTLLIPYLIACFFLPVTYLVIELIPGCSGFVNSESPFSDNLNLPVGQLLYYLFIDCGGGIPFAFHLWFLRDLIIIVAVSPLLYLLRKSDINKYVVCGIMFGLTFLKIPYLPTFGIFWFMFGGCFLDKLSKVKYRNSLSIMYLLLCIMELTFPEWGGQFLVFRIPIILVGVVCMWLWYDKLIPENFDFSKYGWVKTICGFTFFIYLYHEPTINIVRKILVIPFGHNSLNFAFCYLISPWAFILLFIPIGILMKKYIPSLYGPLVGGR